MNKPIKNVQQFFDCIANDRKISPIIGLNKTANIV